MITTNYGNLSIAQYREQELPMQLEDNKNSDTTPSAADRTEVDKGCAAATNNPQCTPTTNDCDESHPRNTTTDPNITSTSSTITTLPPPLFRTFHRFPKAPYYHFAMEAYEKFVQSTKDRNRLWLTDILVMEMRFLKPNSPT